MFYPAQQGDHEPAQPGQTDFDSLWLQDLDEGKRPAGPLSS